MIFGGRRPTTMPLIFQAFNWIHGVYLGATVGSEMTAAAAGTIGQVRRDPMAMLPFCGYNMGDYFAHWLEMRGKVKHVPRIFHVNWFRKGEDGKFLWPGYGENMRVLKWIVQRCQFGAHALETSIGWTPDYEDLDMRGLEEQITPERFAELQRIDRAEWQPRARAPGRALHETLRALAEGAHLPAGAPDLAAVRIESHLRSHFFLL